MNRTPLFVGGLFLAVVGAGAIWLGPRLMRHPSRTPVPPVDRIAPDAPAISRGTNDSDLAKGPESDDRARLRRKPKLTVTQLDGAPLPDGAQLEYSGGPDDRGFEGRWVRASGLAWTRIPPSDPDGVVRVRLPTAGPALFVTVRDADGRPAKGIPVEYGFEGLEDETRDDGTVQIQSMPAGVLRVNVGGGVRTASPIRVRMGVDRKAEAVLEPGWAITVHVMDEAGKPIPGAYAAAYGFDGVRTAGEDDMSGVGLNELPDSPVDGLSDRAGAARLMTRIDERLAIFVSAAGYTTTAVRAPLPDPRAPLASDVTARIGKQGVFVGGTLRWATTDSRRPEIRAEPAVLAPIRESIGREDALTDSIRDRRFYGRRSRDDRSFTFAGLDPTVPWRITVRGPVVPEDHVIDLNDLSSRKLLLRPEPASPDAGEVVDATPKAEGSSLRGRVTDVKGVPLRGITVGAEGQRAVSDADGMFVVPGVPKGRTMDVTYGWVDGADPGPAVPQEFAPWFQVRASASDELLSLVLPKAASVKLRLTDGLTGKSLSWARVVILDGDNNVRFDAPVATYEGRVSLEGLVPGTAGALFVFAPGLRREVSVILRAGEATDAGEVGLIRGGRVTGTVKDRAGAAVAGASVAVMEDGRVERGGRSVAYGRDLVMRRTFTDAKGAFVLEGLDTSRPAAIGIAADGYSSTAHRVLWSEGEDAAISVTLPRGGSVRLQLFDPKGGRVSGAFIELEDARTGVRQTDLLRRAALGSFVAASDDVRRASAAFLQEDPKAPGVYRIGPVESGPYDVIVTCPGFQPQRAKFTVPDSEPGTRRMIPTEGLDWRLELTPSEGGK